MTPVLNRRWLPWIVVLVVLAGIAVLSAQPFSAKFTGRIFGSYNHLARKTAHVSEFALATIVLAWALRNVLARTHWATTAVIAGALAVGYACLDEWHQSFVPGRTACVKDVLIDSCGVLSGLAVVGFYNIITKRRRQ
jgi:VanZ family protein